MKSLIFMLSVLLPGALLFQPAYATGGVGLTSTRLIYPMSSEEEKIGVINTSLNNAFLVQSWVTDMQGKKSNDFAITPPLFVLKPGSEGTLRISKTAIHPLPTDRESIYYLSSKAIPSTDSAKSKDKNTLQIATQTNIKLFIRPESITLSRKDALKLIHCKSTGSTLDISNQSPYYITMVNIRHGKSQLKDIMVPPFTTSSEPDGSHQSNKITFQTLDDFGALTAEMQCM